VRVFWICLIVSVGLHLLFFQDVLQSMLKSGEAPVEVKAPDRINIRVVKRKKPEPKPVAKKVILPKPTPKPKLVATKPEPKPKPELKPKPKPPKPAPRTEPVARQKPKPPPRQRPIAQPKPRYPKSSSKPNLGTPKAPQARSVPKSSAKRMTSKSSGRTKSPVTTRENSGSSGGKTGLEPDSRGWEPPNANSSGPSSAGSPVGDDRPVVPAEPASEPKPAPKPPPPPAPNPPDKPKEEKRVASSAPRARKEVISVPTIDPPAKFRREKLKGELKVRFKISADGTFEVTLSDSSGNKEFDDFVLEQIRRTAVVEPGIDEAGNPKRSVTRRPVNINID
jgi:TonB family protein